MNIIKRFQILEIVSESYDLQAAHAVLECDDENSSSLTLPVVFYDGETDPTKYVVVGMPLPNGNAPFIVLPLSEAEGIE